MIRFASLCLVVVSVGCATNGGSNPGSDSGTQSIVPRAGGWSYVEVTQVTDTCGAGVSQGQAGNFVIDQVTPPGFRVVPGDGTAAFPCSLSAARFDCPNRAAGTEDLHPSVDAVLSYHATANGVFSDAAHATGSQDATVQCTGSGCGAIGTFPCTISVDFTIKAS